MVKKIILILFVITMFYSCDVIGGYKPITISKEDFQNLGNNPTGVLSNSNFMEQMMVINILEKSGNAYLFACAADYESKKKFLLKQSPWGVYYKKIGKTDYDIIVDMEKLMEFFASLYK